MSIKNIIIFFWCPLFELFWRVYRYTFQSSRITISDHPGKVLLVHMSGIGNFVMLTPTIDALKSKYPDVEISLLLPENGCADVIRGHKFINEIITFDFFRYKWSREFFGLLKDLRRIGFKTVIVSPMGFAGAFIAFMCGASYRIGHYYTFGSFKRATFLYNYVVSIDNINAHEVEQNLDLLKPLGINVSGQPSFLINYNSEYVNQEPVLRHGRVNVGIHPGCGIDQPERRWPKECFIKLADRLNEEYDVNPIFFGGPSEKQLVKEIVDSTKKKPFLVMDKPLGYVISVIDKCDYFITTDSGLGHIASGLGKPTLAIFGPANDKRTRPYGPNNIVVRKELPCSPCYTERGQKIVCEHRKCLTELSVDEVLEGFNNLLTKNIV